MNLSMRNPCRRGQQQSIWRRLQWFMLCGLWAAVYQSSAAAGEFALDLRDLFDGGTNNKATVLLFVSSECPISNRYAPEFRRLHEKFGTNGVRFRLVYPDPDDKAESIHTHTNLYGLSMGAIRDPQHDLVKRAQATVTPESAVFTPEGRLVYHGRIDNRYVAFGKERPEATEHDLEKVLEDLIAGHRVRSGYKQPIGCYIPR
jgi:AhpC/TSA family